VSLLVDRRIGSADLYPAFEALGIPTALTTLRWDRPDLYGEGGPDCEWVGFGIECPIRVGVEIKTVNDVLQSMQNGSLATKARGLVNTYDRTYLIVEEVGRPGQEGILEHYVKGRFWAAAKLGSQTRGFQYSAFEKFLFTIQERANIRVRTTVNRDATIALVAAMYRWWQEGEEAHESILALDKSTQERLSEQVRKERGGGVSLLRQGPTFKRRVAAELPGIEVKRSAIIAGAFSSVKEMCNASEKDYSKLPGIGKDTARKIVAAFSSEE